MAGNIIKIFFFKTQACNNNLHAVTWQSWIWIPYSFKSWVALYQITFFISCIVRQLSFPCHNAFWHKSVQKNLRSSGGLLFHWAVKIMKSILACCFEDRKLNVHFVTSWRWELDPLSTLHLRCSQPTLQACLGFPYSDGGDTPSQVRPVEQKAKGHGSPLSPCSAAAPAHWEPLLLL